MCDLDRSGAVSYVDSAIAIRHQGASDVGGSPAASANPPSTALRSVRRLHKMHVPAVTVLSAKSDRPTGIRRLPTGS
jgi:hypothetical protein